MKITESYLRKIIRGAINEMMSSADATPSFHDSPQPEEIPTESPEELVNKIVSQIGAGTVDPQLMSQLERAIQAAKSQPKQSDATPYGLGENKRRR